MRGFIVLCLSAVALAAPQGYNYNPAGAGAAVANFASSASAGLASLPASSGSFVNAATHGGAIQQPQQSYFNQGGHYQQQQQHHHQQQQQQLQQALISKRFYIHSAPEDAEEDYKEKLITVGVPRKNYNVVFIKSPSRTNKKTAIKISPAPQEEKTVIYVLNKKTDSSDVQAEVIEHPTPTTKPEVFFIKYKTNEEAQHAQQEIQAQYDALGGTSQITDEGVAPVTSVIGSLGGAGDAAVDNHGVSHGASGSFIGSHQTGVSHGVTSAGHGQSNNAYLPPNF